MNVMRRISFHNYKSCIISAIIFFILMAFVFYFLTRYNLRYASVINGLFLISTAIVTSLCAINKYHSEQRTDRLQKIYFEDTLLGQARSIEKMMSRTTRNMLRVENLCNLLNRQSNNILIKDDLQDLLTTVLDNIPIEIDTVDFKKETISIWLGDARISCNLAIWIKDFQDDVYRFSAFLQDCILFIKSSLLESYLNINDIEKKLKANYMLIKRHYILFSLFAEFVLVFANESESYTSYTQLLTRLQKEDIKKITNLINESYQELIMNFNTAENKADFWFITDVQAARLDERIKCFAVVFR